MSDNQSSIFEGQQSDQPENYLNQMVGDGKKYSSEEELAKGNYHAQKHIESLETQMAEMKEDLLKRKSLEDLSEQILNARQPEPNVTETPSAKTTPDVDEASIKQLVAQAAQEQFQTMEAQRSADVNQRDLAADMVKAYGGKEQAEQHYINTANELGMSLEEMNTVVGANPEAARRLLGMNAEAKKETAPVNIPAGANQEIVRQSAAAGNHEYGSPEWAKQLRRENPDYYYGRKGQIEVMNASVAYKTKQR